MLQGSVKDEKEQEEGLCLIHGGFGISPLPQWDVAVLTLGQRQESGEDFHREISNICPFFLSLSGKI